MSNLSVPTVALSVAAPPLTRTDSASALAGRRRIESIDLLRGTVMILMALDHTRDFLGVPGVSPTDLTRASVFLFLTRWMTHFCAPVFFLLTGTSAYLAFRGRSRRAVSRYLLTRGLWLIFLELTLFRCLAFQFNFDYHLTVLNVLWALGWAMIVLSLLVHLPPAFVAAFGIALIAGHNLLDSVRSSQPIWSILHAPGFVLQGAHHSIFTAYPLIPWVGVTAVGYSLAVVYGWEPARRRSFLVWSGVTLTICFIILRAINVYGDPIPWTSQPSALFTTLWFLNTNKYPPSLLFLLMTLGPALIFLGSVEGHTSPLTRPVLRLGQVPLFYFLLHIPLIHAIAVLVCYASYGDAH